MGTTERSRPWADESAFQMIDIAGKSPTHRTALARGTIHLAREAYLALREGRNPKGDVLKLAEIAGVQAAKKTSDLIPLCHPLPLEKVRVGFRTDDSALSVTVLCEVSTTGKTGVEMEALCGVNGALLAIYDLSKAVDPVISISGIRLEHKEGGKHGLWTHPDSQEESGSAQAPAERLLEGRRAAVLTISDRCSRGEAQDRSGPAVTDRLGMLGAETLPGRIVPDEIEAIRRAVNELAVEMGAELIVTTGGTGVSPRDVTPEAIAPLWTRRIPGFGELLRARGAHQTEMSWLSRSEAGFVGQALVVLLPGSTRAVEDGMRALERLIPHAIEISRGGSH